MKDYQTDEMVNEMLNNMTLEEFMKTDQLDPDPPDNDMNDQIEKPKHKLNNNKRRNSDINSNNTFLDNECLIIPTDGTAFSDESIEILKSIMSEFQYTIKDGIGKRRFPSGAEFYGEIKNGKFIKGTYQYPTGDQYIGEWKDGMRHGDGKLILKSGVTYSGSWINNKIEGYGIMIYNNGEKYEGEWKNGKMNGIGILTSINGDTYEGEWKDGKYDGRGIFTKRNGDKYEYIIYIFIYLEEKFTMEWQKEEEQ